MRYVLICFAFLFVLNINAQEIPYKLEELTATDFVKAVDKSSKTVILPIGVFEKHGPHMPLGTDLYTAREIALRSAEKEYTVVFPWYYFSQINEARHQPGTIAYSPELIWNVLQETLDELNRNGFDKIIIINGHGGNNSFLNYFGMSQLSKKRDYSLYCYQVSYDREVIDKAEALTQHDPYDQHAGNRETSIVKAIVPDLVFPEKADQQSGVDLDRLNNLNHVFTGIWWYAQYPNHYSGDGSKANKEAGELILNSVVNQFVNTIREIKEDRNVTELQEQFYKEAENPLDTKQ
ncbi:MAG: creatininase family protein [Fermentimonas sp.]|nr:creatininase family protein [Fermentimonas sp.]